MANRPPSNMILPQGQTANSPPFFPSFLPSGNQMATGLTPQMQQQINAMQPQAPQTTPGGPGGGMGGAAGPSSSYQQLMDFFGQMGGFGGSLGGGMGPGAGGGMGGGGMSGGFGPNPSREQVQQAMQAMYFGRPLPGQANVPKPPTGANGMVSPSDLSAYTSAKQQADKQRDQLAKQIIDARKLRRNPGGSR